MTKPLAIAAAAAILWFSPANAEGPTDILNVSYDVSRELYADIDKAFNAKYKADTGTDITINQSHAGSSKQARAVLEGLKEEGRCCTIKATSSRRIGSRGSPTTPRPIIRFPPSSSAPAIRRTSGTGATWCART